MLSLKFIRKLFYFYFIRCFRRKNFSQASIFWLLFLPIPCYKVWFHFSISTKENSITKLTWNVKVPQRRITWLSTSELTKHGLQCPKCLFCSLRKYSQFIMKQMILNWFNHENSVMILYYETSIMESFNSSNVSRILQNWSYKDEKSPRK